MSGDAQRNSAPPRPRALLSLSSFDYYVHYAARFVGYTRFIRTDRGSIFISELIKEAWDSVRVTLQTSTAEQQNRVRAYRLDTPTPSFKSTTRFSPSELAPQPSNLASPKTAANPNSQPQPPLLPTVCTNPHNTYRQFTLRFEQASAPIAPLHLDALPVQVLLRCPVLRLAVPRSTSN